MQLEVFFTTIICFKFSVSFLSDDHILRKTRFQKSCFTASPRAVYETQQSVDCARKCARLARCTGFIYGVLSVQNIQILNDQLPFTLNYLFRQRDYQFSIDQLVFSID
jgi:hypothetical protein